jgi:hypothetical protein
VCQFDATGPRGLNIFSLVEYQRISAKDMNMLDRADYYFVIPAGMNSADAALTSSNNFVEKRASKFPKAVIDLTELVDFF